MSVSSKKPLAIILGAAFLASAAVPMVANADVNPFSVKPLNSGYDLANFGKDAEGKCGEGKCGEKAEGEGKCGEGKCGAEMKKEGAEKAKDGM